MLGISWKDRKTNEFVQSGIKARAGQQESLLLTLPYRCSLSDTTLDTMVLHSSLLVAISAHLFMFIPVYRETFPSHPHLLLPRPRLPFTMPVRDSEKKKTCTVWPHFSPQQPSQDSAAGNSRERQKARKTG